MITHQAMQIYIMHNCMAFFIKTKLTFIIQSEKNSPILKIFY